MMQKKPKWKLRRPNGAAVRDSLRTTGFRRGSYSAGMTAMILAILIVCNLLFGEVSSSFRTLDLTNQDLFSIGDVTQQEIASLDTDVTITTVAQPESIDPRIEKLVESYGSLSDHIKLESLDPVLHPAEAQELGASDSMLVVSCEETGLTEMISFSNIITYSYSYYGATEDSFDGEGQLTSAIHAVTNDTVHTVYMTEGHGEGSFGTAVTDGMDQAGLTTESVNLFLTGAVPEDCEMLVIYNPTRDFNTTEIEQLSAYLSGGGNVLVSLTQTEEPLTNLNGLLADYGMEVQSGYVADMSRNLAGDAYAVIPEMLYGTDVTSNVESDELALVYNALGMSLTTPVRDTITTNAFLQTSADGYLVTTDSTTQGTWVLGAVASETISQETDETADAAETEETTETTDTEATDAEATEETTSDSESTEEESATANLIVFSAGSLASDEIINNFTTLSNLDLFLNAITMGFDDVDNISIPARSLSASYNMIPNSGGWAILLMVVLPLAILITGFVYWFRRRKR